MGIPEKIIMELVNKKFSHVIGEHTLNEEMSIAYVHIPKSGSSTLRYLCNKKKNGFAYRTVKDLNKSNHIKSIVFVRNPYDRFNSAIIQYYKETHENTKLFSDWLPLTIDDIKYRIKNGYTLYYDEHFVPQHHFISLFHNLSYIKLEYMAQYFKNRGVSVPSINKSTKNDAALVSEYTKPIKNEILKYYEEDLSLYVAARTIK